jgi:hypothetical protein
VSSGRPHHFPHHTAESVRLDGDRAAGRRKP